MLRFAPHLTLTLCLGPIAAGLIGALLPAFGYFPSLGGHALTLQPWRDLFATPGFGRSLQLSLVAGFGATLLSLGLAVGLCATLRDRRVFRVLQRFSTPLLATPHAAIAIGFAFLILPSGWIVRMVSPELTGWSAPPAIATVKDEAGLSFLLGLLLKEVPYLVLMIVGASTQVPARALMASARAMGYRPATAWVKIVFPQIYGQIRFPVYAVLVFSLSVVDVALLLAPGNPPPLAVLAARWFSDYDLRLYFPAAAAAILQLLIALAGLLAWRGGELLTATLGRRWIARGARRGPTEPVAWLLGALAVGVGLAGLFSIAAMIAWSFAQVWRFPDAWPSRWGLETWSRHVEEVMRPALATIVVGAGASITAVALALACLENEQRRGLKPSVSALWLLYLPLLVPQIAFLFGVQVVLVRLGLDGSWFAVVWAHLLVVLPYVFLSLADPWRALDRRYARIAAGLGVPPHRVLLRVKLPLLLRPVLIAGAVGFAVSVGQYLPTLFAGAGRIATLTTDAVTLAGGADRRIIGVYAALQSALPLLVYGVALAIPALVHRHRRALA